MSSTEDIGAELDEKLNLTNGDVSKNGDNSKCKLDGSEDDTLETTDTKANADAMSAEFNLDSLRHYFESWWDDILLV